MQDTETRLIIELEAKTPGVGACQCNVTAVHTVDGATRRPVDPQAARSARRVTRNGFTLLEVLVSLVIFGIITLALSMALAESLRAQTMLQGQEEHSARIRVVFDVLTRDIEAAYPTLNTSSSVFVGGGSGSSGSSGGSSTSTQSTVAPGSLLTLSSLSHRIVADDLLMASASGTADAPSGANAAPQTDPTAQNGSPQWDCNLIRYDLDTTTGTLRRTVTPIPNLQLLTANADPGVQTVITDHVVALTLRYWDATQQTWRDNWDFEQQNQPPPATPTTGQQSGTGTSGTGGTAAASAATTPNASTSTTTGDTYLPSAVEVTVVLQAADGTPMSYVTVIPILAPQPQTNATGTAAPVAPATSTTGTTGTTGTGN